MATSAVKSDSSVTSSSSNSSFTPRSFDHPISDKLNENNHKTWQEQALAAIFGQALEDHLHSNRIPSQFMSETDRATGIISTNYKRWRQEDYNIISCLASMDESFKNKMICCVFAPDIWNRIEDYFSKSIRYRVKQLKTQLKLIKKQGLPIADYVSRIKRIVDSLASLGFPLTTDEHIDALLEGLNEDYENLITTVSTKSKLYSLQEVEMSILSHDDMLKKFCKSDPFLAQAHLTQSAIPSSSSTGRSAGGRRGRGGRFFRGGRASFANNNLP
nr:uncharacterized protein LOC114924238 [Arachis hypogaea]